MRNPMCGVLVGCCASATAPPNVKVATRATSLTNFRFWILDFRLTEEYFKNRYSNVLFMWILSGSKIGNLKCHLMTLSARASTLGGIVRSICFAAFRLMISSNFVGCSTGRSAGLAPFRILSTLSGYAAVAVREVCPVVHEPTGTYT